MPKDGIATIFCIDMGKEYRNCIRKKNPFIACSVN